MADTRHKRGRRIPSCVFRLDVGAPEERRRVGDSLKSPHQGQFDNVHLAPRMRLEFEEAGSTVKLEDIVMAPFCIHDCLHMHTRWSAMHRDKHLLGFDGFKPNRVPGAPTVPTNQTVFASFPDRRTLRYRAVAERVNAGEWQNFLHHGFGYIIDTWPAPVFAGFSGDALFSAIKSAVEFGTRLSLEPHPKMPATGDGWARLYWRLRHSGKMRIGTNDVAERLTFDLDKCMQ